MKRSRILLLLSALLLIAAPAFSQPKKSKKKKPQASSFGISEQGDTKESNGGKGGGSAAPGGGVGDPAPPPPPPPPPPAPEPVGENAWLRTGSVMAYTVSQEDKPDYKLVVFDMKIDSTVTFTWKGSGMPVVRTIPKNVLDTAAGISLGAKNRTALWVSKKVWQAIKDKKEIAFTDESDNGTLRFTGTEMLTITVDDKDVQVPVLCAKTSFASYCILDDPDKPLILKMEKDLIVSVDDPAKPIITKKKQTQKTVLTMVRTNK